MTALIRRLIAAVNKLKPAFTLHVVTLSARHSVAVTKFFNQALAQFADF